MRNRTLRIAVVQAAVLSLLALTQNCDRGFESLSASSLQSLAPAPVPTPNTGTSPTGSPSQTPVSLPVIQAPADLQLKWSNITQATAPQGRRGSAFTAIGNKFFVWAGAMGAGSTSTVTNTGMIYDPATTAWTPISAVGAPSARYGARAVYTGSKVIVFGGMDFNATAFNDGGIYDPATDKWESLPQQNQINGRAYHAMSYINGKVFVFSGQYYEPGAGYRGRNDGYLYDLQTAMWSLISEVDAPPPLQWTSSASTGDRILLFGGYFPHINSLYEYSPTTDKWTLITAPGAPQARAGHSVLWSGKELIVFGGTGARNEALNDTGLYNPTTKTWRLVPGPTTLSSRTDHAAAFINNKMFVWGGFPSQSNFRPLNSGNLFD